MKFGISGSHLLNFWWYARYTHVFGFGNLKVNFFSCESAPCSLSPATWSSVRFCQFCAGISNYVGDQNSSTLSISTVISKFSVNTHYLLHNISAKGCQSKREKIEKSPFWKVLKAQPPHRCLSSIYSPRVILQSVLDEESPQSKNLLEIRSLHLTTCDRAASFVSVSRPCFSKQCTAFSNLMRVNFSISLCFVPSFPRLATNVTSIFARSIGEMFRRSHSRYRWFFYRSVRVCLLLYRNSTATVQKQVLTFDTVP